MTRMRTKVFAIGWGKLCLTWEKCWGKVVGALAIELNLGCKMDSWWCKHISFAMHFFVDVYDATSFPQRLFLQC